MASKARMTGMRGVYPVAAELSRLGFPNIRREKVRKFENAWGILGNAE